uniref:Uncharacterized protein n=1 Tax=Opuntia streptacantha TaxID=393608 RepID=A0A7C8ZZL5_OPUST
MVMMVLLKLLELVLGFLLLVMLVKCKSSGTNSNGGCNLLFHFMLVGLLWVFLCLMLLIPSISTSSNCNSLPEMLELLMVLHLLLRVLACLLVIVVVVVEHDVTNVCN